MSAPDTHNEAKAKDRLGTVVVQRPDRKKLSVRTYIPEILKGMRVTNRHFWRNLGTHKDCPTVLYPEKKRPYPSRFRGRHRLMTRPDGSVRCVACMMCATSCPAECIHIVAEDTGSKQLEKRPVVFDIDLLLCVFCGNCVEACPCDAIRMDTSMHPLPRESREEHVITLEELLASGSESIAPPGGKFK